MPYSLFLYVCMVVGYGDIAPETQEMRFFCVFFIMFSVGVTAEIFSRLTGVFVAYKANMAEKEFLSNRLTSSDLELMDTDDDGEVSNEEFMKFMLVTMGKISAEDWDNLQVSTNRKSDEAAAMQQSGLLHLVVRIHLAMSGNVEIRELQKVSLIIICILTVPFHRKFSRSSMRIQVERYQWMISS